MPHHVRELTEQRELEFLSPYAAKAVESAGRSNTEEPDPVRTAYQRDRDRILHSKSFRRLKHKTQVFIDPQGDHFRTRLTHSLEVAQIARTVGRALRLNEDLIEAIALGHDVGHPPFGHAGEHALDEAVRERFLAGSTEAGQPQNFRHYEQSLRIIDHLEALNLTQEVRAGIGGHSKGRADLTAFDGEPTSTLEAAVVRISDRIAYLNHDLDDALRAGIILIGSPSPGSHAPALSLSNVSRVPPETPDKPRIPNDPPEIPSEFIALGAKHSDRIGAMVEDVIINSLDKPAILMSKPLLETMNSLKEWLFEKVYLNYPTVNPDIPKAQAVVKDLFRHFCLPGMLPEGYEGVQGAVDYVAGMTDRFAVETFANLRLPRSFR